MSNKKISNIVAHKYFQAISFPRHVNIFLLMICRFWSLLFSSITNTRTHTYCRITHRTFIAIISVLSLFPHAMGNFVTKFQMICVVLLFFVCLFIFGLRVCIILMRRGNGLNPNCMCVYPINSLILLNVIWFHSIKSISFQIYP